MKRKSAWAILAKRFAFRHWSTSSQLTFVGHIYICVTTVVVFFTGASIGILNIATDQEEAKRWVLELIWYLIVIDPGTSQHQLTTLNIFSKKYVSSLRRIGNSLYIYHGSQIRVICPQDLRISGLQCFKKEYTCAKSAISQPRLEIYFPYKLARIAIIGSSLGLVEGFLFVLLIYLSFHFLNKNDHLSQKTREMQRRFLIYLIVQLLISFYQCCSCFTVLLQQMVQVKELETLH